MITTLCRAGRAVPDVLHVCALCGIVASCDTAGQAPDDG